MANRRKRIILLLASVSLAALGGQAAVAASAADEPPVVREGDYCYDRGAIAVDRDGRPMVCRLDGPVGRGLRWNRIVGVDGSTPDTSVTSSTRPTTTSTVRPVSASPAFAG